jgi:alkanesulfonate monooxygenase SsuD/methylene tetrahydromethanopterin reductase-like flavin-dependent oxidoreductase (luciferase family)
VVHVAPGVVLEPGIVVLRDGLFEGRYYKLKHAAFAPRQGGARPIPIMVGGTGERRTLSTFARYGDIMNVIASPERVRQLNDVLARHCEEIGCDPAEIKRTVHMPIRIERDEEKAKKLRGENHWAMIGTPTYVIDRIADFLVVGVTEFIPQIRPQRPEVYEAFDPMCSPHSMACGSNAATTRV